MPHQPRNPRPPSLGIRSAGAALGAAALFLAVAAPLPGELKGCGGDTSGSVNKTEYCRDKCSIEAGKVRACDLIEDSDEAEDAVYEECIRARQCANPPLCLDEPDYYISNREADECFRAIERLSCGGFSVDGLTVDYDSPEECLSICDPM